jgi:DNA primase large subunit
MMARLLTALEEGQDIGHYGRLTFAMVAQWFMEVDEIVDLLTQDRDFDEGEARALVAEVRGHGYNPPKREQILRWQSQQDFQICQEIDDPNGCNVYKDLKFPDQVYENIEKFWEERSS